ncbi:hypothetical protein Q5752_006750 [Cryptotrichosporon argae]
MPMIQQLAPHLRPLIRYLPYLPTPLLTLPFALGTALASASPVRAFLTAPTTHALHPPLALTLALVPLVYTLGILSGNVSWVDRIWTTYPLVCSALVAAWAVFNPAGAVYAHNLPRIAIVLLLQIIWSIRLSIHTSKRGFYSFFSEDYRYTAFRQIVPRWFFELIHVFVIALAQPLLLFSLCLPVHALLVLPPSELPSSRFSITLDALRPLMPSRLANAPGSTPVLSLSDAALFLLALGILYVEARADAEMYAYQTAKHAVQPGSAPFVRPANSGRPHLPQPTAYPAAYHPGFPTRGLFALVRHPNFAAEQLFWLAQALFVVGASSSGVTRSHWVGPSVFGPSFALSLLFCASTFLTEWITQRKFSMYADYRQLVGKFVPQQTAIRYLWTTLTGSRAALQRRLEAVPKAE